MRFRYRTFSPNDAETGAAFIEGLAFFGVDRDRLAWRRGTWIWNSVGKDRETTRPPVGAGGWPVKSRGRFALVPST
jgi:hypothetical protein